jgi:hypothetical protein
VWVAQNLPWTVVASQMVRAYEEMSHWYRATTIGQEMAAVR